MSLTAGLLCTASVPGSLELAWQHVEGADLYDVHWSLSPFSESGGADDAGRYISQTTQEPSLVLEGLAPETGYHIRVRSHRADGGQWDWDAFTVGNTSCTTTAGVGASVAAPPVTPGTRRMAVVRISEGQELPDFLSSKDAGDFAGDMAFVTKNALSPKFFGDFDTAVINFHCVEILDLPLKWANYSSCSGGEPGTDTHCTGCVGSFDKQVAKDDCSAGPELNATLPFSLAGYPAGCDCTEEAKAYTLKHPGRLPVYLPFMEDSDDKTLVGYWYSFPGDGECAFGHTAGSDGCTWRRLPVAQALRGFELKAQGFLVPSGREDPEMDQKILANAKIVEDTFRAFQPAAWGCGDASGIMLI